MRSLGSPEKIEKAFAEFLGKEEFCPTSGQLA